MVLGSQCLLNVVLGVNDFLEAADCSFVLWVASSRNRRGCQSFEKISIEVASGYLLAEEGGDCASDMAGGMGGGTLIAGTGCQRAGKMQI